MGTCIKRQQLLCNLPNISSLSLPVTALISLTPPPANPPHLYLLSCFHQDSDLCLLGLAVCH